MLGVVTRLGALFNGAPEYEELERFRLNLIVVRHAERSDKVDKSDFQQTAKTKGVWPGDPWLTKKGKFEQSPAMAKAVSKSLEGHEDKFKAIYVSPMQRTLATAEPLCQAMNKPLVTVKSLAYAAAVIRFWLKNEEKIDDLLPQLAYFKKDHYERMQNVEYRNLEASYDHWHRYFKDDERCWHDLWKHWLMNAAWRERDPMTGEANMIVVSHRELIYGLMELATNVKRRDITKPDYASAASFTMDIVLRKNKRDKKGRRTLNLENVRMVHKATNDVFDASFLGNPSVKSASAPIESEQVAHECQEHREPVSEAGRLGEFVV